MSPTYKQPGKIKISRKTKENILDLLDTALNDLAFQRGDYRWSDHPQKWAIWDLNDLYREIQGADYLIKQLQKLKVDRAKEADKLLKRFNKKQSS